MKIYITSNYLCFFSGLIIGVIIGIFTFSIITFHKFETLHQNIANLKTCESDNNLKLKKLEDSINKNKYIVKDIKINLIMEDDYDKLTIEKFINKSYSNLLGKEVKKIDADLAYEIIENRIYKVHNKEYVLKVDKLIVSELLSLWVSVKFKE